MAHFLKKGRAYILHTQLRFEPQGRRYRYFHSKKLTEGGSIAVFCLTGLASVVSIGTNNNRFSYLVKSNPVKLETSLIGILPLAVSVL